MSSGAIYSLVAFVSLFQLLLIYNRSKATAYKETIDWSYCHILLFFSAFCLIDGLWGICDSKLPFINRTMFTIVTYGYHTMCAFSAFVWFGYMIKYTRLSRKSCIKLNVIRITFIVLQLVLIITNAFTHKSFYIDEDLNYYTGSLRLYMYLAQFLYYIVILLGSGVLFFVNKDYRKPRFKNTFIFSLVPLIFGIGQYMFYDVAMYSLGFVVSAFIIYAFNVAEKREEYYIQRANDLEKYSKIDGLTGVYNRNAYEQDLIQIDINSSELCYCCFDLNNLKVVNDSLGHEAGDEIIKGAATCLQKVFARVGKVFRTGGDEFTAIIYVKTDNELDELKEALDDEIANWTGDIVKELSISAGYAMRREYPDIDGRNELIKISEQNMYKAKAQYYATRGQDRRGQQEAHKILCSLYTKILKINLTADTYTIINCSLDEDENKNLSEKISVWLKQFAIEGRVHPDDVEDYLKKTDLEYLRNFFKEGNPVMRISYRRKYGKEFRLSVMEIVPASDFSKDNISLYLYVKGID